MGGFVSVLPLRPFSKIENRCPNQSAEYCTRLRTLDYTPLLENNMSILRWNFEDRDTLQKTIIVGFSSTWVGDTGSVFLYGLLRHACLTHSREDFMRLIGLSIALQ